MKRKRWIKLMMSYGVSRNVAVQQASARGTTVGVWDMELAKVRSLVRQVFGDTTKGEYRE